MPNTPALVQSSATALYADPSVDAAGRDLAETIMRAVGLTLWVDSEAQIDAVTAVSGSGPAYFFYIMEAIEEAAINLGLSAQNARLLTLQTAFGAAKMALESPDEPQILRQKVSSPGGTTERALTELQQGDLKALFNQAIKAACERSQELAKQLGQQT
jgi:pyrroline-5-carboxylate reductase